MARTVAGYRAEDGPPRAQSADADPQFRYRGRASDACGMCTVRTKEGVRHDQCREEIHTNEGKKDDIVWRCRCAMQGHREAK